MVDDFEVTQRLGGPGAQDFGDDHGIQHLGSRWDHIHDVCLRFRILKIGQFIKPICNSGYTEDVATNRWYSLTLPLSSFFSFGRFLDVLMVDFSTLPLSGLKFFTRFTMDSLKSNFNIRKILFDMIVISKQKICSSVP